MANITLYELGDYNSDRLIPHTFDIDDIQTYEDWLSAVSGWLRQLTRELGSLCGEW